MLKSKIIRNDSTIGVENELNTFLATITADQLVRMEYVVGGSGSSSYHYYSVLVIYDLKEDVNQSIEE
jgi:hypothetical protein